LKNSFTGLKNYSKHETLNAKLFLFMLLSAEIFEQQPFNDKNAVVKLKFIYTAENVTFQSCHASTIKKTENGPIATWFGGKAEKDRGVGIWLSTFSNGSRSIPVEVANDIRQFEIFHLEPKINKTHCCYSFETKTKAKLNDD
jgi:hypothetical protein